MSPSAVAQDDDGAVNIIAAQIRRQGFACKSPESATKEGKASKPDLPVWVLDCGEISYRVQLVPNMAAKVERLD